MVVGIIAGGDRALRTPHRGRGGRSRPAAPPRWTRNAVTAGDVVIGIAASGTTPFVRGALARARALGATTALIACSEPPPADARRWRTS